DFHVTGVQTCALPILGPHPLRLLRARLAARRYRRSRELEGLAHGTPVRIAGLVTGRQRPQTASGVTFVTLEDEDGNVNVVVWSHLAERRVGKEREERR